MPLVARVLIDSPLPQLDRLFDYAIPPALQPDARPGVRVKVPLRSAGRMVEGWNGMREELRETAQERSAEWKARHDSDPKE